MMKISLLIEAINRATGPVSAVSRSVSAMGSTVTSVTRRVSASFAGIGTSARAAGVSARGGLGSIASAAAGSAEGVAAPVSAIRQALESIGTVAGATAATTRGDLTGIASSAANVAARIAAPVAAIRSSIASVGVAASVAGRSVAASFMGMIDFSRDAAAQFRVLAGEEGMARAARSAAYLRGQLGFLTSGLSLLKFASVAAGIGIGEAFVKGVFKAGGEMQRTLTMLTVLDSKQLGADGKPVGMIAGATRARRSMDWISRFSMGSGAALSMPDIIKAFRQAQEYQLNPEGGSLAAMANLASGIGAPLQKIIYAVKDAMEGTSMRPLANLGIRIRQGKGPNAVNTFTYGLGGPDSDEQITTTAAKNPTATLREIIRIMNLKYAGLAAAQAKTVPGGIEQMRKLLYAFEAKVAGAGVFDWALSRMNQFFAFVRKASANGALDRLAKRISDFMTGTGDRIIAFVQRTNWNAVARNLTLVAGSIVLVARAIGVVAKLGGGGLSGLFNLWIISKVIKLAGALAGFWPVLRAAGLQFFALARMTRVVLPVLRGFGLAIGLADLPLTAIVGLVAAAVLAGWALYRNWDRIAGFFRRLWARFPGPPAWLGKVMNYQILPPSFEPPLASKVLAPVIARLQPKVAAPAVRPVAAVASRPVVRLPVQPTVRPASRLVASSPSRPRGSFAPSRAPAPLRAAKPAAPLRGKMTIEVIGANRDDVRVKRLQATGYDVEVRRGGVMGRPG